MAKKTKELVWNDMDHTKETPGTHQFKSEVNRKHMIYVPKDELNKLEGYEGEIEVVIRPKSS